jgi:hypothetical protein
MKLQKVPGSKLKARQTLKGVAANVDVELSGSTPGTAENASRSDPKLEGRKRVVPKSILETNLLDSLQRSYIGLRSCPGSRLSEVGFAHPL